MPDFEEDYDDEPPRKPFWRCESCGAEDRKKPLPKDRDAYYRNPKPGKCKKCGSDDLTPVGF